MLSNHWFDITLTGYWKFEPPKKLGDLQTPPLREQKLYNLNMWFIPMFLAYINPLKNTRAYAITFEEIVEQYINKRVI